MAKKKSYFVCSECGFDTPKWMGQCPSCKSWNTFQEFKPASTKGTLSTTMAPRADHLGSPTTFTLTEIDAKQKPRIDCRDGELNRVLGGGLVVGSICLLGGEPGIGKSTLLLQTVLRLEKPVLYVAGEESPEQIKMRAERMSKQQNTHISLTTAIEVQEVLRAIKETRAEVVIVDSIQTVYSSEIENVPGSVAQLRQCTMLFQRFAKQYGVPIILVGHITKEGQIAGPKLLEHIVDVVLQFEGEKMNNYRILRSIKNRFGSTEEIGLYQMSGQGLHTIDNPSQILLSQVQEDLPGTAIGVSMEGRRPLLLEIQALVSPTIYSTPQRSTTGFDLRRLNMILAVLEKKLGLPFTNSDVFLNVVGGIKVVDPAIDLAVAAALISSQLDKSISRQIAFCAELGLTGEVRGVTKIDSRLHETEKLGFAQTVISSYNKEEKNHRSAMNIQGIAKIAELYELMFT